MGVGENEYDQGDGSTRCRNIPVQVSELTDMTAVAGAGTNIIALKSDGTVWTWGENVFGQLGDGTTKSNYKPVQASGLTNVVAIGGGVYFSVALKNDGTVWAWGNNGGGQLGDGTTTNRYTPVQVTGLAGVTAIAVGSYHSLALKNDGTVWAWGENWTGELGESTRTTYRTTPVQVGGVTGVAAIGVGSYHSLALKNDGTVWAWGYNGSGQLGDGTAVSKYTPVQVSRLTGVTAISAGETHTVALRADGTVWEWGNNYWGQLGDWTTTDKRTPVQVSGISGVKAIAAGIHNTVALKNDYTIWTWGKNEYGQLGDQTWVDRYTPVQVTFTDTSPPDTTVSGNLVLNSSYAYLKFLGTDNLSAESALQYSYRVDNGNWSAWSTSTDETVTGLSDGNHIFYVKAKDEAGNEDPTPAQVSFTVDTTPPLLYILSTEIISRTPVSIKLKVNCSISDSTSGVASLSYTVADEHNMVIRSGSLTPPSSGNSFHFTVILDPRVKPINSNGKTYTILVTARDKLSNANFKRITYTVYPVKPIRQ